MGMMESVLQRLPLSPAMFYLPIGYALGPSGLGLIDVDAKHHAVLLTSIAEIALLISIFTVGLKLRVPWSDAIWWLPIRLGVTAMLVTIVLMTGVACFLLQLPLGAAVLLAAILAPTDPILASDVQIRESGDRDRIRFGLSGEGGLNDGTAFPFVMVGLGLMAIPEARAYAHLSAIFTVLWEAVAGLVSGGLMGWAISRLVVYLRRQYRMALGMEEFLTLGMIALSFGVARLLDSNGFIAVFAAGVAMRRIEHTASGETQPREIIGAISVGDESAVATDSRKAPAYMTETVLDFNQQLEHIAEFIMVLLLGVLLSGSGFSSEGLLVAALLFLLVRPLAVLIALTPASNTTLLQRRLIGWFGIRGVGSLYYLVFALQYPWLPDLTQRFISLVLTVVAASVLLHGISSTPLMALYYRRWTK